LVASSSRSSPAPAVRCVLQHWYELRPKGEKIGTENNHRFTDLKALLMVGRRQGLDALHVAIINAAKGSRTSERAYYPVGAGLFTEDLIIETFVRKGLQHQRVDYRVAATFGSAFYLGRSEEVAFTLAERVVLPEGDALVVQAAREVLDIWADVRTGGKCRRCGLTGTIPQLHDLEVARIS